MKQRAEQNPPAQIAVFNPVERGRKVRSGWLLLCYWNMIAQCARYVKYITVYLKRFGRRNTKPLMLLLRQIPICFEKRKEIVANLQKNKKNI